MTPKKTLRTATASATAAALSMLLIACDNSAPEPREPADTSYGADSSPSPVEPPAGATLLPSDIALPNDSVLPNDTVFPDNTRLSENALISGGTVITIRDLQLKTMNEAEAILASGTWQPRVLPSRAFKDAKRSRDTPEQKSQWIVVNVCFPVGEPRDVLVTTFPPSELSPEMRRDIQDGRPPYEYPTGECVEGKDSIDLSHPPA